MYIRRKRDFESIDLRLLEDTENDINLVIRWLTKPEIYNTFLERRLNSKEIRERYDKFLKPSLYEKAYIIEYDRTPVGIVEHYYLKSNELAPMGEGNTMFGIKILIGETDYWDNGIASAALNIICKKVFQEYGVDYVVANIMKTNVTAVHCFKRAGFKVWKRYSFMGEDKTNKKYLFMVKKHYDLLF